MMQPRPSDLPNFKKPPVNEVVLGIQFAELRAFSTIHAGLLWSRLRKEFARFEEHPTLTEAFELFGGPERGPTGLGSFEVLTTPPVPRYWFINADDTRLIQIQKDKLFQNWRKTGAHIPYPHFEEISEDFQKNVALLKGFLSEEHLGEITCNQCEVSYINHISVGETERFTNAMERVFGDRLRFSDLSEVVAEETSFKLTYRLGSFDAPAGRLRISADCAYQRDGSPIIILNLTARGQPFGPDADGYIKFMTMARSIIVRKFTDLTSPEMHKVWERTQ